MPERFLQILWLAGIAGTVPSQILNWCAQTGPDIPPAATGTLSSSESIRGWSHKELRNAQPCDPEIKPVLQWQELAVVKPNWEEIVPRSPTTKVYWSQWESLRMCNGVLYGLWKTLSGDATVKQLVLPLSLRLEALQQLHNIPASGHLGVMKTQRRSCPEEVLLVSVQV